MQPLLWYASGSVGLLGMQEDDREDAARLKALHLAWQAQSDDLEKL